jgi:cystathionine beta-lyase family protein involved in aluminum resistance
MMALERSEVFAWAADLGVPTPFIDAAREAERGSADEREAVRRRAQNNQLKVMRAFAEVGWGEGHFAGSTGYGYHDTGREALDESVARVFGAEAACVRWNLVSGTHALSALLFGNLRPGDVCVSVTGAPYDTLKPVLHGDRGSLDGWGVRFEVVDLGPDGRPDLDACAAAVARPEVRMAYVQRSCGYDWRPSLDLDRMRTLVERLKAANPRLTVLVDNCYGEMVEPLEPTQIGADCLAGSLIKNLGGCLAPTGGYVAGREPLVEGARVAMTAPGISGHQGATLDMTRTLAQGLFMSPMIVGQALEGAVWAAALFERLGFEVSPRPGEPRTDIIQALRLGTKERLAAFCRGVQAAGPIDARAVPQPVMNPGYRDPIIMAGGSFVAGSSMELSADGPLREPYAVYLQGGMSYVHVQMGVMLALRELHERGIMP